jgi:hypothetical protein
VIHSWVRKVYCIVLYHSSYICISKFTSPLYLSHHLQSKSYEALVFLHAISIFCSANKTVYIISIYIYLCQYLYLHVYIAISIWIHWCIYKERESWVNWQWGCLQLYPKEFNYTIRMEPWCKIIFNVCSLKALSP